eukprot:113256-Hanusia_phi.AAC.2
MPWLRSLLGFPKLPAPADAVKDAGEETALSSRRMILLPGQNLSCRSLFTPLDRRSKSLRRGPLCARGVRASACARLPSSLRHLER